MSTSGGYRGGYNNFFPFLIFLILILLVLGSFDY
jgi:hypothetical protein